MTGIDTNVLIYACDKANPRKQRQALDVIASSTDGVLLWQVACEFVAASRKLASQGFSAVDAWARLSEYMALFPLVRPAPGVLDRARTLHLDKQFAFWDALMIGACLDCGVTRLFSEDLPGGEVEGLEIVNPFA
jgi:predicted nucleic acid-binding protein